LDSKKKRLWKAQRQGAVPNFVLLTVESPRWRPEPKGIPWVQELRRRARCMRRYEECLAANSATAAGKVCQEFGISPRTLWRWRGRYRGAGLQGLIPSSRRPRRSPRQTRDWLEGAILAIRLRTGWGVERIAEELKHAGLGPIAHSGVYGVLKRRGMTVPLTRRSRKAGFRYQRDRPNDLWHMDVKGPMHLPGIGPTYGIAILDDCSRFCLAATLETNKRMKTCIALLEEAVAKWGAPRQLMSDNGSEFLSVGRRPGPSRFLRRLGELGIEHLPIKLRTPETNGKIERFWLTLEEEFLMRVPITSLDGGRQALWAYVHEYDFNRRHSALDYRSPAQIFCPEQAGVPMPAAIRSLMPFLLSLKQAGQDHA
jgi:transposase InsO family protein